MYAHAICARPGSVLAPASFTEALRRDTGNPALYCWWEPTVGVRVRHNGEDHAWDGAWVIWERITCVDSYPLGPFVLSSTREKWVDVYKLDGEHGLPVTLGPWVAQVLLASDETRWENRHRDIYLADLRAATVRETRRRAEVASEDFRKDKLARRVFQRQAEKMGVPLRTKAEVDEIHKRLLARDRAQEARVEALAKEMRMGH